MGQNTSSELGGSLATMLSSLKLVTTLWCCKGISLFLGYIHWSTQG